MLILSLLWKTYIKVDRIVCGNKKKTYICIALEEISISKNIGEMAEWSIAAVLKTVELRGSGGSNPSLSAKNRKTRQRKQPGFFIKRVPKLA